MKHTLLKLCRDSSGVSALELAIVAPVLVVFSFVAVDITKGFALRLNLEQAATRVVQLASVSPPTSGDLTYLEQEGASASAQPVSNVSVKVNLECNGVVQGATVDECPHGARQARRLNVVIKATYVPPFSGISLLGSTIQMNGKAEMRLQ